MVFDLITYSGTVILHSQKLWTTLTWKHLPMGPPKINLTIFPSTLHLRVFFG